MEKNSVSSLLTPLDNLFTTEQEREEKTMSTADHLKELDINKGIAQWKVTPGAVLLDVRTEEEFSDGRVPGSRNVPLPTIPTIEGIITDKDTPVFVYCLSGGRSNRAAAFMKKIGYTNVTNIGGIKDYTGELEM